jgi:hypothetical protein
MKAVLSKQTPIRPTFIYNPLDGAKLNVFHHGVCSSFILKGVHPRSADAQYGHDPNVREAIAALGYVRVILDGVNEHAFFDGREITDYSIIYPGKKRKKMFGRY